VSTTLQRIEMDHTQRCMGLLW